jgi:hypothetical protein
MSVYLSNQIVYFHWMMTFALLWQTLIIVFLGSLRNGGSFLNKVIIERLESLFGSGSVIYLQTRVHWIRFFELYDDTSNSS